MDHKEYNDYELLRMEVNYVRATLEQRVALWSQRLLESKEHGHHANVIICSASIGESQKALDKIQSILDQFPKSKA